MSGLLNPGTDKFLSNLAARAGESLQHYSKLSENQLTSISMYTSDYYEWINKNLRGQDVSELSPGENEFYKERASDMVLGLFRIPNAKRQMYYRGFSGDTQNSEIEQMYASLNPGDKISDKGFSSFSTNPEEAKKFLDPEATANTLLVLDSAKMKQIDFLSQSPEEEEHLAMPMQKFRVKSNKIVADNKTGINVRVVELEDDEPNQPAQRA